jgi:hypothetical protein
MKRGVSIIIFVILVALSVLVLANCLRGREARTITEEHTARGFETKRVSTNSSRLPQGETEIAADNNGHVLAVWMDGSPFNQLRMTLRIAESHDGGKTFAEDRKVDEKLIMVDPTLIMDQQGNIYLGALRKDTGLSYDDLAVIIFRSTDAGKSWSAPVQVNDENVFNDRPWLTTDAQGKIHLVYGRRVKLPDGNYERSVFYQSSVDGGKTFSQRILINPPANRAADSSGGSSRGIAVLQNGNIVIGYQGIPKNNKERYGTASFRALGSVIVSKDGGRSFGAPLPFTVPTAAIADARVNEAGTESFRWLKPFPHVKAFRNQVNAVWISEARGETQSLYVATLPEGRNAFNAPVAVASGPPGSLTLPAMAIDPFGIAHIFWLGQRKDGLWTLFYAHSLNDTCQAFSPAQEIYDAPFPIEQWPGDFINATANASNVFVAWALAGGPAKGIYVSIGRGIVGQKR